jgi:hypothetical protein
MTQTAFDHSNAKQISSKAGTHPEPKYSNDPLPTVTLPEGLDREEADTVVRAMEFLCILIAFYDEMHGGELATADSIQEYGRSVPQQ